MTRQLQSSLWMSYDWCCLHRRGDRCWIYLLLVALLNSTLGGQCFKQDFTGAVLLYQRGYYHHRNFGDGLWGISGHRSGHQGLRQLLLVQSLQEVNADRSVWTASVWNLDWSVLFTVAKKGNCQNNMTSQLHCWWDGCMVLRSVNLLLFYFHYLFYIKKKKRKWAYINAAMTVNVLKLLFTLVGNFLSK